MRLCIFCVLAFCASSSLAQRSIQENYDEMYEEPFFTEEEGEAKVDMEHLDNVDKDEGKSKEDLENAENGHDIMRDYQLEDNRSSESNYKQNIVEVPTEPMNSPASDIESEDSNDGEEDSENYSSEAENVSKNAKEPADFQADSEDIEENDTEYRENQKSRNSDATEIVEQQIEPMNSSVSDIESEDNDDDEEDSENDDSETKNIVDKSYELDSPVPDGTHIENNNYDENPDNHSFKAENFIENTKEPSNFRADSEDIEEEDTEYKKNIKSHYSDASKIVNQQTEPINSPASDIESEDNDDGKEDPENYGSETDSIVEESYKLDPPTDGKDIEDNDNSYDGNPENYSSEAENVNKNAKEPADFQSDSENIEEKDTEYRENQKNRNSDATEIVEQQIEPMNSPVSDIESEDNDDDDEEDSENNDSETNNIVDKSYELDSPAPDGTHIENNNYDENPENYSSEAENVIENAKELADFQADIEDIEEKDTEYKENLKSHHSDTSEIVEQQREPLNSSASDIESEDDDDDEEDSENYISETDDIVKESNELVDLSADGADIKDKYSGFEKNLENDDSKVNSKEKESEKPINLPVDDENRKYYDAGQEENQANDGFEGDDIVEDLLIPVNSRTDNEDLKNNTSGYKENVDFNIDNSENHSKAIKPVDLSIDGDDLKDKYTDNEENKESYDSEAYDYVEEPIELGHSLANNENSEDNDALVNKVNNKMFKGYNYNDSTLNEDSAMDQNRNYDKVSTFIPITDKSISEDINGTAVNFGNVTPSPCNVSTSTEENEDSEPSLTEHSNYVDSDIKTRKDDENKNTTDSNMAEKTSQHKIDPMLTKDLPRADYYSSEAPTFSSNGIRQNIVPGPLGDTTDYSNVEVGDDLPFNHKYAGLYSTDSTNAEENEDYEPSGDTSYSAFQPTYSTAVNPRKPPVFVALPDETPHFIDSPDFHDLRNYGSTEYYINAQSSGIELNITYFSILEDSGAYLLVKPGGLYANEDDAIMFSYQERQERMYRFKDVDRLYMFFYTGNPPSNSFHLSVRMLNEQDPWSYEQPSLTVALGGSTPSAFDMDDEKKEVFGRLITRMAEKYTQDRLDTDDKPWTNITEVTSCTNDPRDGSSCVKVTFRVTYRNYYFNLNHLMRMWYTYREEYTSELETMGLKLNWSEEIAAAKQEQHRLVMWLVTGAGVFLSAVMLVVALWRCSCFKGYTRMPAHGDTESLTKEQPYPALYAEQQLTWDDDKATKVDLDGYANIGFAEKLLDMDSDDDIKTKPSDRKTISPSDVYQV